LKDTIFLFVKYGVDPIYSIAYFWYFSNKEMAVIRFIVLKWGE
jgi:hypothetical protein